MKKVFNFFKWVVGPGGVGWGGWEGRVFGKNRVVVKTVKRQIVPFSTRQITNIFTTRSIFQCSFTFDYTLVSLGNSRRTFLNLLRWLRCFFISSIPRICDTISFYF
jgi:hypothetical protein